MAGSEAPVRTRTRAPDMTGALTRAAVENARRANNARGIPMAQERAEQESRLRARLQREWGVELGQVLVGVDFNQPDAIRNAQARIAVARMAIAAGKHPPERKNPETKGQTEDEKRAAFIKKKNLEALGKWAMGWKPEHGNASDFTTELTRERAETMARNGAEVVSLREDAIPPVSGGAFGRRVLALAPGIGADIRDFPAWFDRFGDIADPSFRLQRVWQGTEALTNMCIQRGIPLDRPDVDFMFQQLDALMNNPAMHAKEQGMAQGGVVSSAAATESYNLTPDKVAWVRERIAAIRNEGGLTSQLSNYDIPYMELRGAMRRIKETNMGLWAEAGYQFAAINVGATAKGCSEITQMLDVGGSASPEFFQVSFRTRLNRQVGGAPVCGVAECFRLLEGHRLDYYKVAKDDKNGYLDVIAWEMEGYPYPVARARAGAGMIPPNRWAAQTAHDIWTGTFRNIIPVVDPANGKIINGDSYVYPAYRLATVDKSSQKNPKLKPFFRGEGNKYIDPFFVDFWTYIGDVYNKNNPADVRQANAMAAGFLVPDGRGGAMVPMSLENVQFENIDFVKSAATGESILIPGIYNKWLGYAANTDKFRDATEGTGMFINPTWDQLTKHVADKLWKNLDPPYYSQAVCLAAEGIIEFHKAYVGPIGFLQRVRRWGIQGFFGGWPFTLAFAGLNRRSYSEAETRQSRDAVAWTKYDIHRKLETLVDEPFNIDWEDPSVRRLRAKYHIPWSTTIVEGVRSLIRP